jgi:hypothetical protein
MVDKGLSQFAELFFKRGPKGTVGEIFAALLNEWERKGYVSENYSSITGTGDDARLSSDKFHSWGALFGIISFIERGYLPAPEKTMRRQKTDDRGWGKQ